MSFEINNMKVFTTWSFSNTYNTDCTICRQPLNNKSLYSKEILFEETLPVILKNTCGHSFHKECIIPWLANNKHCPNCSKEWTSNI